MTPYEQYLLNDFKPYTVQDNPYTVGTQPTIWDKQPEKLDNGNTVVNELSNKPRYDITGERYGNTLSDDMFSIKNAGRIKNRHTPESYGYYNVLNANEVAPYEQPIESVQTQGIDPKQILPFLMEDFRDNAVGREKNIGEGYGDVYRDGIAYDGSDYANPDVTQYMDNMAYYDMLRNQIDDLSTYGSYGKTGDNIADDVRYIKSGGKTYHSPGDATPRWDAVYEPTVNDYINLNRMSPATLKNLADMGPRERVVDYNTEGGWPFTPIESDLNGLINLYRRYLGYE